MKSQILAAFLTLTASHAAMAASALVVGDGQIDGTKLAEYEHTWFQCTLVDKEWVSQPALTERLQRISDSVLRLRHKSDLDQETRVRVDMYFDRESFAPLFQEQEVLRGTETMVYRERKIEADGYYGIDSQGGAVKEVRGKISSAMLHGGAMGLPLATLPYQGEPLTFAAAMLSFDGTYEVTADWVGTDELQHEGKTIELWLIDVAWLHHETGDTYPPGPDASGGRYWIANSPPTGVPYVIRYKTDTYAVEFEKAVCP